MKTFRFIGMALVAVLMSAGFAACSSDDDDDNVGNVSNIYGTWEETHYEGWEKTDGEIDDSWNMDASELKEKRQAQRFVFTKDGEISIYYWSGSSWYFHETYDYTISGNKLCIEDYDGDEEDLVMSIKTLSESVLVLEGSYSDTEGGEKYEVYEVATFKKVD